MHELSIAQSIIDIASEHCKKHQAKPVKIGVVIGKISGIVPDSLRFCFESSAIGTIAEGAILEIEEEPCEVKCNDCGKIIKIIDYCFICTHCKSVDLKMISGKELYVSKLEMT